VHRRAGAAGRLAEGRLKTHQQAFLAPAGEGIIVLIEHTGTVITGMVGHGGLLALGERPV